MSLTPYLRGFWDDPWEGLMGPSRLFDQRFGNTLTDDLLAPQLWKGMMVTPRLLRPPQSSGMSEVSYFISD